MGLEKKKNISPLHQSGRLLHGEPVARRAILLKAPHNPHLFKHVNCSVQSAQACPGAVPCRLAAFAGRNTVGLPARTALADLALVQNPVKWRHCSKGRSPNKPLLFLSGSDYAFCSPTQIKSVWMRPQRSKELELVDAFPRPIRSFPAQSDRRFRRKERVKSKTLFEESIAPVKSPW